MTKKALSLPILISMVVGNMIGTGIYLLPASLAHYGTISIVAWIYTSIGALFLALTFAHLNKQFPKTGGPYVYCREAFGKLVGFIIAYTYLLSNLVSIAGIAVASVGYLGFFTPILDANTAVYSKTYTLMIELGFIWLFTCINIIGLHTAGLVQIALTLIKLIPLIVITLFGFGAIHWSNLAQFQLSSGSYVGAITSAATLTFWAFIGLESATVPAESTEGPRDIYKATVFGTLITAVVYIASTFVLMGMIPSVELQASQFPFADAGVMLFGASAAKLIAICAVVSGLGALNVCILVQGQIVFAAARDQLFPKIFAKRSKRDVPVAGQLLSSCLVSAFLFLTMQPSLLKQFNEIALLAGLLTLITYFTTTLAELKFLSLKSILGSKSFYIALLAACYTLWMISSFTSQILIIGFVLILCCVPVYYFVVRHYRND